MKTKNDYTREESFKDCVATAVFTFVVTGVVGIGLSILHWPEDRSESAYYKGEAAATAKHKDDFRNGWEEGVKQTRAAAAENGKGKYQIDPVTGKVQFVWK